MHKPEHNKQQTRSYASLTRRLMASIIDLLLLALVCIPLLLIIYGPTVLISPFLFEGFAGILIIGLLPLLTIFVFWFVWGATPGKLLLKLRIIDINTGKPPTFSRYIIRLIAYGLIIVTFGLSLLLMQFRSKHQALHDTLSQTAVVHNQSQVVNTPRSLFRSLTTIISQVFSNLTILAVATFGFVYLVLIPLNYMPAHKLYTDLSTSEFARQLLHRNKVLHDDRYILLFHPTGLFYTSSGTILTSDRVIIYWKTRDGIQIDRALLSEITRIDMLKTKNVLFDTSIELTTKDATLQFKVSQYQHYDTQFVSKLKQAIKNDLLKRKESPDNPIEKEVLP